MATLWEQLGIAASEPDQYKQWIEDNKNNPVTMSMPGGYVDGVSTMTMPASQADLKHKWQKSLTEGDIQGLINNNLEAEFPFMGDDGIVDLDEGLLKNTTHIKNDKGVLEKIILSSEEPEEKPTLFSQTSTPKLVGEIKGEPIEVDNLNWNSVASSIVTNKNPSLEELGLTDPSLALNQQEKGQKALTTVAAVKADRKKSKGLFGDMTEEKRAMLIMWLNSMRLEPDPGITTAMQERLKILRSNKNKSGVIAKLVEMGRKDLADMVSSNTMTAADAIDMAYKDKDLKTKTQTELRKEFQGLDSVKSISMQVQAFGRVIASAEDPSAAGDLALIFNYMKILDPGSTVREGEFANAQNSGGVDDRVIALYNSLFAGTRLSQVQRDDFINRASRLYSEAERQLLEIRGYYVKKSGMEDEKFAAPIKYTGNFISGSESLQEQIERIKALRET